MEYILECVAHYNNGIKENYDVVVNVDMIGDAPEEARNYLRNKILEERGRREYRKLFAITVEAVDIV